MKHIVYVLTLAFVMMASTALAQTESQLCDQIIIDGKTYPATRRCHSIVFWRYCYRYDTCCTSTRQENH